MKLTINGEKQVTQTQTLQKLLVKNDFNTKQGGFAVAVNNAVVPKNEFSDYKLNENDHIEIICATQGG